MAMQQAAATPLNQVPPQGGQQQGQPNGQQGPPMPPQMPQGGMGGMNG